MLTDGYTDFISFLIAVATGAGLCIIYDFFRVLRIAFKSTSITVFFEDLIYATVCAVITFCILLLRCSGRLRFFIFAGEIIGFILFRFTLSKVIIFIFSKVIKGIKTAFYWVKCKILIPIGNILTKWYNFALQNIKKLSLFAKKALQHIKGLLYNGSNKKEEKKTS